MPSSFVARLLESPAEREHKNLYGKGISPSYNGKDVVSIAFENTTKELAESWITDHEFAGVALEEIPEQIKPTTRSLAIDITSSGGKFERNGNALTIKNAKLLAEGVWTDSMQKTPWRVKPEVLERYASNWTDDAVWNRHAGGQHRAVTDKIGNVQNVRYADKSVTGDVVLHGLTQNSRDAAALVEAGQINHVSVETYGSDRWNVGTKEFEAQDITFTGLALANRGACKVCTLRENSEPDLKDPTIEPLDPKDPVDPIQDTMMTPEEITAIKADMMKELSVTYDGKIKELSDKLADSEKRVKELAEAEAEMKTKAADATSRDLAEPTGYRVDIDSEGNVCRVI